VRGLLENVRPESAGALIRQLADTSRYATTESIRERITSLTSAASAAPAGITGRLAVSGPAMWRIGVVAAGESTAAWTTVPATDGAVLAWMADAVSPAADGGFAIPGLMPGWYRLALLAPAGVEPADLAAMVVTGDPGRFELRPGQTVDVGVILLRR
jgi:hypothetical protein